MKAPSDIGVFPREALITIGRVFFGLALVAFGVLQFVYGDFVPGRAPAWPAPMPGRLAWAYTSGALLIFAGAAIILGKRVRVAAILAGSMIFFWALLRHLPLVAANPHGIVLTAAGKALALVGGAFAVAGAMPLREGFVRLGRACLATFMILGGSQHFIYHNFVVTLIPSWMPVPMFWTYFAGVALILGGGGLLLSRTVRLAATLSGMMIFLWVFLLHLPRVMAAGPATSRNEWTALFEALAFSGIAFVLAGTARRV